MYQLGKALAITFPAAGAAIGIALAAGRMMDAMARQPEMAPKLQTMGLLSMALIEATAIYGLLISFMITG